MLGGSGLQGRRSLAALSQIAYQRNDDDEEEAARERRRRARQERLRQKQEEESLGQVTDQVEVNAQNSVADEEVKTSTSPAQVEGDDDEAALLERLARREERRQKRLQEALERQKEFDPTVTDAGLPLPSRRLHNNAADSEATEKEEKSEHGQERYEIEETEIITKSYQKNDWRDAEEKKPEEKEKEEEEEEKPKQGSREENQVEVTVEGGTTGTAALPLETGQLRAEEPRTEGEREQGSDEAAPNGGMETEGREQAEADRARLAAEERARAKAEQEQRVAEEQARLEAEERAAAQEKERREAAERERVEQERRAAEERQRAKAEEEEKAKVEEQKLRQLEENRREMQEKRHKGEKVDEKMEGKWVNEKKVQEDKLQTAVQKKQEEEKGAKAQAKREKSQEEKPTFKKEIKDEKIKKDKEPKEVKSFLDGKKGFTEVKSQNGEFLTHKLKHTENTFSLPQEEKRRLKEEIERRRAEAAEKRQKMPEDSLSDDKKPFKCFTPKGSSLKIEERAEFLNKSVQKSGVKSTHQAAVVSKIDSRLEQYTSAIEGTKTAKPLKPAASDLPVPAEGVRNIKSMWEKGNVFSSPTVSGTPNKETAGLKVGVSSRINEWLTKTPDGNKSPAPKPSDLRPGDVSGKRNLWEKQSVDKVTSPTKQV
ncbi:caldesmon [Leptonychotes weddellii]|uniref:Caldesmon n=1 Tax=Leptonychotes weddellii TaxID=9713 RepID=A0A7F8QDW6_LEPWE|nr:caldesmon [Leptonychotes weddellii]